MISFLLNTAVLILLKDLCFYSSVIYVQVIAVFTLLYSKTINPAFSLFIIDLFILVELNEPGLSDFIALVQYKCTHFRKRCGVFEWTTKVFCLEDRKKNLHVTLNNIQQNTHAMLSDVYVLNVLHFCFFVWHVNER